MVQSFFFFKVYIFLFVWLHQVSVAVHWIFVTSRGSFSWWHTNFLGRGGQAPDCTGSVLVAQGLSCPVACGILVPWSGIEHTSSTSQGRFSTTLPPGKSHNQFLYLIHFILWRVKCVFSWSFNCLRFTCVVCLNCICPFLSFPSIVWNPWNILSPRNPSQGGSSLLLQPGMILFRLKGLGHTIPSWNSPSEFLAFLSLGLLPCLDREQAPETS